MGIENVGNVMVLLDLERLHNRAQWLILSVYIFTTYLLMNKISKNIMHIYIFLLYLIWVKLIKYFHSSTSGTVLTVRKTIKLA